jgi:hypothetical protein
MRANGKSRAKCRANGTRFCGNGKITKTITKRQMPPYWQ